MVTTRTSSKISGTGSIPLTGDRDLPGQAKQLPGSPCSITKKTEHKRDDRGYTLCAQKMMTEDKLSPQKSKKSPGSSAAQVAEV